MNNAVNNALQVIRIFDGTAADGPGFRTSIYFSGCLHQCPGCHNPQSWAFDAGESMTIDAIMKQVEDNDLDVTFSGGDPLYQCENLIELAKRIKQNGRNIWCFTGFTFEQILHDKSMSKLLQYIDVLVDGPFMENLRDISLLFRGSANQRLVNVPASLKCDGIKLWER